MTRDREAAVEHILDRWERLSSRSQRLAVIRHDGVRPRRPASVGVGLLATAAVAVALVVLVNRGTGPAVTPQPSSQGPSAIAVGPSVPSTHTPSSVPFPVPTATPTRLPGKSVDAGQLVSATDGWALSAGTLLMTHDGGRSWTPAAAPAPAAERVVGAAFADALHGWVIGELVPAENSTGVLVVNVHRTDDGGATWASVELASIPSPGPDPTIGFPSFSVLSADRVFVLLALPVAPGSVSRLYVTADGGRTWDRRSGVTEGMPFRFIDETHGWAIRNDTGVLVRTVDGGRSWDRAPVPILFGYLATIPFPAPDGRLVMSLASGKDGEPERLATSDDLGSTWTPGHAAPAGASGSIAVLGDGTWLLSGNAPVLSHDDGATWVPVAGGPPEGVGDVAVADGTHLSMLVGHPSACGPTQDCFEPRELWISDDAGLAWRNATP